MELSLKGVRHGRLSNTNSIYSHGVMVRVGLEFSIDKAIGGQLTAGNHSRHYRASCGVVKRFDCTYMRTEETLIANSPQ